MQRFCADKFKCQTNTTSQAYRLTVKHKSESTDKCRLHAEVYWIFPGRHAMSLSLLWHMCLFSHSFTVTWWKRILRIVCECNRLLWCGRATDWTWVEPGWRDFFCSSWDDDPAVTFPHESVQIQVHIHGLLTVAIQQGRSIYEPLWRSV